MIKNLIAAAIAFLTGVLASDIYHKQKNRQLQDTHKRALDRCFNHTWKAAYREGNHQARLRYAPSSFLDDPIKD